MQPLVDEVPNDCGLERIPSNVEDLLSPTIGQIIQLPYNLFQFVDHSVQQLSVQHDLL